jgi:hypothetical protein
MMSKLAAIACTVAIALTMQVVLRRRHVQLVTVEKLKQVLAADKDDDAVLSQQLSYLKLTDRLSSADLAALENNLPGVQSRLALTALADESAFLNLPAVEIPDVPPPDSTEQSAMIVAMQHYVGTVVPALPNFFATRTTRHFRGTNFVPPPYKAVPRLASSEYHPFIALETAHAQAYNLKTRELDETDKKEDQQSAETRMNSSGEFGPILARTSKCVNQNNRVTWKSWEQGQIGRLAAFHYECTESESATDGAGMPRGSSAEINISGEIALDPETGAIMRLTRISRGKVDWFLHKGALWEQGIMVEYLPQQIDGHSYICPVKSVVMFPMPPYTQQDKNIESGRTYYLPVDEFLNDIYFDQYHLFKAKAQMLPGYTPKPH